MSASEEPWQADKMWGRIRRGWCVGEETFRGKLEGLLAGTMQGRRRESYSGEIARRHDEVEAERVTGMGLEAIGIGEDDLAGQAKGSAAKYAIAWLVRRHTSVRNGWIKQRLGMGTATNFASMLKKLESARPGDWGYAERRKAEIIKL